MALEKGLPVVALESTIVAHGFPRPYNLEVGRALEETVIREGATPATIAIVDGEVHVGLGPDEMERLALDEDFTKASVRDLAVAVGMRQSAATTVAATAHLAHAAGVRVFATGGIGGVHRDGESSLDVSADLRALGRTPIAVVSAGAKAILDLGRTLEVLETQGVPVIGFACDTFPAFYTRGSDHRLTTRIDDIESLARICSTHWDLGLSQAVLVCNPVPASHAMNPGEVEGWIRTALAEAAVERISGKALTPFLLHQLYQLSEGRTLVTNRALAEHNAALGARLARALCGQAS
jgi:pseudouridylate synthase